jgi:CheY-like chemotaxis protein
VNKGTGLGLSQVYGFARRSGGTAVIESEEQRGTKVTLYLPRSPQPIGSEKDDDDMHPNGGRHEIVLVVEDNTDVRSATVSLLHELGYRTVEADSAESALCKISEETRVDIVFSDIVLPGSVDGAALARDLASRHPSLPILLTTGYARGVDGKLDYPVLRKPYDVRSLDRAIRRTLDEHSRLRRTG